jgi:putative membrane protein
MKPCIPKIGRPRNMMMGGGLVIGLLVLVLLLLVIGGGIAAVVWFTGQGSQGTRPRSTGPQREDKALAILRQRYARGEIDREEFERMREELRS